MTLNPSHFPSESPTEKPSKSPTKSPTIDGHQAHESTKGEYIGSTQNGDGLVAVNPLQDNLLFLIILAGSAMACCCLICILLGLYKISRKNKNENKKMMEMGQVHHTQNVMSSSNVNELNTTIPPIPPIHSDSAAVSAEPGGITLESWLNELGLIEYYQSFKQHGFGDNIKALYSLKDDDLKDLGVQKMGHRKLILTKIYEEYLAANNQQKDGNMSGYKMDTGYNLNEGNNLNVNNLNFNLNVNRIEGPQTFETGQTDQIYGGESDSESSDASIFKQEKTSKGFVAQNKNKDELVMEQQQIMNQYQFGPNTDALIDPALNMISKQKDGYKQQNNMQRIQSFSPSSTPIPAPNKNKWPQKCAECQATALGKMDTDGSFYCNACWELYEQ